MAHKLISILRSILCLATNIIAFVFSLFSMAFCGQPGFVSLFGYMLFVCISAGLNFLAWWLGSNPVKSALAVRMLVLFGFAALMGSLSYPILGELPYAFGWVAFTSACALVSFTFWRWKRDLTQFLETKPNPESWRTAKIVVYQYGVPFTPIYVALFGIFILIMSKFMLLTLPWLENAPKLYVLPYVLTILAAGLAIVAGGLKLIRSVCRPYFPDKPYIWGNSRGLNVADRFFIDWKDVVQINEHYGRKRAVIGAEVHSRHVGQEGPLIVPLDNATVESKNAIEIVRSIATENGFKLPELTQCSEPKYSERAYRRAYRNPELRQMVLDSLESLPARIAQIENDIANLPSKVAEYENGIICAKERAALSRSNLQKMKKLDRLKKYPDFELSVQKTLELNAESIRSFEQLMLGIPRRTAELEKHRKFLIDSLADCLEKKQRYLS
jgi:hypothetical protein